MTSARRPRRRALGDLLRHNVQAERLAERGIQLRPSHDRSEGQHGYRVFDADGTRLGKLILRVVKFRDVPDDQGFEMRDGLEVSSIELEPGIRGKRLGTKLYEVAASAACDLNLPLVSDQVRSHFAEAFWRKQRSKGRAYTVEGGRGGGVFSGPRVEAEANLYAAFLQEEIRGAGARTEAELARKDPQRFARAQERVEAKIDAWRERLPTPKTSDAWEVERYVLDDACKYQRDLSGMRRKKR
jgi:GNAT superfamily N-acetyltransferase